MTTKQEFMREALGFNSRDAMKDDGYIHKKAVGVPEIAPFADWDYYYLRKPIEWVPEGHLADRFEPVVAPKGFVTDLASIPRVLWPVLPPTSRYTHAAIIHDFLYWMQTVSRSDADQILRIGMRELRVPFWKVPTVYWPLKFFGGKAWRNNARLKEQGESRFLRRTPKDPTITWEDWKSRKGVLRD